MTNRSMFRVGNIGHDWYFVVGAWLSNFCHCFSKKVLRIGGRKVRRKWRLN